MLEKSYSIRKLLRIHLDIITEPSILVSKGFKLHVFVRRAIPENFKKIIFKGGVVLSSIMIIHFVFILQKGRGKNYIVGDEEEEKSNS